MASGVLHNLPMPGSAMDQDPVIMANIAAARRAWVIFGYKPANKIKWSLDDAEFAASIEDDR